ncbi:MAG: aspartate 1-decarboxylase [Thermodesulfobacteriota bacterium]
MQRLMLKSKLHRLRVTEANLNYEGSLTIDASLMKAAGILPFEMVRVYNINNGERFETYAIEGLPDSGVICLNGAAARKGVVGDLLIVATYAFYSEDELAGHRPHLCHVDKDNRIV